MLYPGKKLTDPFFEQKLWELGSGADGAVDATLRALFIGTNKGTLNLTEKDVIKLAAFPPEIIKALAGPHQ